MINKYGHIYGHISELHTIPSLHIYNYCSFVWIL